MRHPFNDEACIERLCNEYDKYGSLYILLYNNPNVEISEMQKAYWKGGNKNEFVVCLGTQRDSVIWCNPFSWSDDPKLETLTKEYFRDNPHLDIDKFGQWMQTKVPSYWKRKEFKDFKYIKVILSPGQGWVLIILSLISSIVLTFLFVGNEIRYVYDTRTKKYEIRDGYIDNKYRY